MGYPEKKKLPVKGKLEPAAQAYFVSPSKRKVYKHYEFNPVNFHLLEMKGKGRSTQTGKTKKIDTHFYGMSGCGLWQILLTDEEGTFSVDYRLIGIMSEFRKGKFFCMIGVKVAIIIQALRQFEGIELNEKKVPLS